MANHGPSKVPNVLDGLAPLVTGVAFLLMLWWSWGKWPDVLVDFGRELYLAWELSEGKVLYRDLAYSNGPLSPYLNSVWFRLFGVGLRTLILCNLALLALTLTLLHRLLAKIGDYLSATVASLVFVMLFAFAQLVGIGNYNYMCPYSHEMTHGIALTLTALCFVGRYLERGGGVGNLAAAGVALGLVLLTRAEVFLAAAGATLVGMLLALRFLRRRSGRTAPHLALFVSMTGLPPLVAWASFASVLSWKEAGRAVLGNWPLVGAGEVASLRFFRVSLGTLEPVESLVRLLHSLAGYALVLGPAVALSLWLGKQRTRTRWAWGLALALPITFFPFFAEFPWDEIYRPLPVLMLLIACSFTQSVARSSTCSPAGVRNIMSLAMVCWALLLLAKIALNTRVHHYGFALAMPATLLSVIALLGWAPTWIDARHGWGNFLRGFGALLLLLLTTTQLNVMNGWLRGKSIPVGEGADRFWADWRGEGVNAALREIRERVGAEQSLLCLPEGVMLNYLSRRRNPTRHTIFMPTEMTIYGEENILEDLKRSPPDYVALVHKDTTEFGARFFGRDYARMLGDWVERNYSPVVVIGAVPLRDDRFGIALLARRLHGAPESHTVQSVEKPR